MSCRLEYLYRDASNYKKCGQIIFAGNLDEALAARLRAALHDGEWFMASQVRIPELFLDEHEVNDDDHCWHELSAIANVDDRPDDVHDRTIEQLVDEFERAKQEGWKEFDVSAR